MLVNCSCCDWRCSWTPSTSPGASPSLSPVTSPSHSPPALGTGSSLSLVTRSPVEFPDTADFLTKPSVSLNLHKPLSYTFSSPDFQQGFRGSPFPLCTRQEPLYHFTDSYFPHSFSYWLLYMVDAAADLVCVCRVRFSCGRQMLKGVSSSDAGESHQSFSSEAQRRRSG